MEPDDPRVAGGGPADAAERLGERARQCTVLESRSLAALRGHHFFGSRHRLVGTAATRTAAAEQRTGFGAADLDTAARHLRLDPVTSIGLDDRHAGSDDHAAVDIGLAPGKPVRSLDATDHHAGPDSVSLSVCDLDPVNVRNTLGVHSIPCAGSRPGDFLQRADRLAPTASQGAPNG